ncbi:DUF977 family protein [Enterobacter quasiroggenkampii]|uniref:DUF977 family protein n=1 Tax=Enterobacter quasiroggenkampii TaxID=2497436 RepID=UPI0021CE30B8|nr:DUF977 family protein [Enterobacter quasiroggenkampii]MCU6366187.1 DUF977 family protein [Enterobacter quasiroggenkampii]
MPRPKTHEERTEMISRIIELVKKQGRITTKDIVEMFDPYRTTAEKYMRIAIQRGGLIRYGRCGIFRDEHPVIDFDLKNFFRTLRRQHEQSTKRKL